MALTSTLFTGLSGLDVNQTRLNVVGNNIANVNTVAFKSSRTIFTPQFYVTDSAGAPSSAEFGGQNPSQRGLGATVGAIQKDFSGGSIEPTGRSTDMAIDGDGFFVVQGTGARRFTRDGSFYLNADNVLVTNSGDFVQGYKANPATGTIAVGALGKLTIPLGTDTLAQATSKAAFKGNLSLGSAGASVLNSQSLTTVGGTAIPDGTTLLTNIAATSANGTPLFNVGDTLTVTGSKGTTTLTPASLNITATTSLTDLQNFYNTALGIDTTGGLTGTGIPTAGASLKSAANNSVQLVIAGNVGASNALTVVSAPLTLTDGTTADVPPVRSNPNGSQVVTPFPGFDSIGNPVNVNVTITLDSITPAGSIWRFAATSPDNVGNPTGTIGTGTIEFDTSGKLVNSTGTTLTLSRQGTGAVTPQTINLDFSAATGLTDDNSILKYDSQDGFPIGTLNGFSIGADGVIVGSYSNSLEKNLGQLAIATFKNPMGLSDNGGNQYSASSASGVAVIGTPLQLGAGAVRSGALELSNVDLSKEFTNLIVATTGFTAASRVITTSDQLIQELLNTTR